VLACNAYHLAARSFALVYLVTAPSACHPTPDVKPELTTSATHEDSDKLFRQARLAADGFLADKKLPSRCTLEFSGFEQHGDDVYVNYRHVFRPGFEAIENPSISTVVYNKVTRKTRWGLRE
jgi:hypothetical protein